MDFVLSSDIIGSDLHCLGDSEEGLIYSNSIPGNKWIVGKKVDKKRDLLSALMFAGCKYEIQYPQNQLKVMRNFIYDDIPWQKVMPSHFYKDFVRGLFEDIEKKIPLANFSYFENVYKKSCEVLDSLKPMKIHRKRWNFLSQNDIQGLNRNVIESFEPNEDGFADQIEYSLIDTISGRAKVIEGPEILRLNKEFKPIIKSRYKKGKVVQFDYVSLEPRLALIIAGHNVTDDVYSYISNTVFGNNFTRDVVKVSTLSVMFGAGAQSLSEKTELPISVCKNIIKQLKEFFGIFSLTRKLVKEYNETKMIRNHFGRALYPENNAGHKLYNNFIQSSAVDAAMLGFWGIVQEIKNMEAEPVFVIHDNMGIDLSPNEMGNISKIIEAGEKIPGLDGKLALDSAKI